MQERFPEQAYLSGAWLDDQTPRYSVYNPATGAAIASVSDCGAVHAERAIHDAHQAFNGWRTTSAYTRSAILHHLARTVRERVELLATTMTAEQGKPLAEAHREILYGASYIEWYAEEAKRILGEIIPHTAPHKQILIQREPIGVVAAITPWNFPHAMIARKMAAALAAGCCCIVKPATETPLSALRLAECAHDAGVPPGVLSVLPCSRPSTVAQPLLASPRVRKISFTGSTDVGKLLYRESAATLKRLTLELGGNAPCIICEDADLPRALDEFIFGKFRNAGQTCVCINRFLVHERIADTFLALFLEKVKKLVVGDGFLPTSTVGPLISIQAVEKVRTLCTDALASGATCVHGALENISGTFVPPLVLQDVTPQMRIWREEIFGPVATITTFTDDAEAISLANDTEYGLASYVYTRNLDRAFRFVRQLAYGMVGVNDTMISMAQAPFGGIKQSGFGREGGSAGIDEYLTLKYVTLGLDP